MLVALLFCIGISILSALCLSGIIRTVCLIFDKTVWYGKSNGMKYTLIDNSIIAEWDFRNSLTLLKLTKLLIQCETNQEQRRKYIRQYNRLKESLKDKYDMSDFSDFKE